MTRDLKHLVCAAILDDAIRHSPGRTARSARLDEVRRYIGAQGAREAAIHQTQGVPHDEHSRPFRYGR